VVVALFFLGGEIIHDFSFALMIGVLVGTYSSIFIASVFLVYWESRGAKKRV
jgi:preprotein translocase subunit SecF